MKVEVTVPGYSTVYHTVAVVLQYGNVNDERYDTVRTDIMAGVFSSIITA